MSLLDPATARRVEQLVRDALALAKTAKSGEWPAGYFAQTAGALAGEQFERSNQIPDREAWLQRLDHLRSSVGTGKHGTSTEAMIDDLRSERGV